MEVEKMSRKYENQSCWWQKGEVPGQEAYLMNLY